MLPSTIFSSLPLNSPLSLPLRYKTALSPPEKKSKTKGKEKKINLWISLVKFFRFNLAPKSLKLSLNFDLFEKIAVKVFSLASFSWFICEKTLGKRIWGEENMKRTSALIYIANKSRLNRQSCKNKLKSLMAFYKVQKTRKREIFVNFRLLLIRFGYGKLWKSLRITKLKGISWKSIIWNETNLSQAI